jgi:hypothetical protein
MCSSLGNSSTLAVQAICFTVMQVYKTPSSLHTASVNSIAFGPQELGLVLACASSDGSVSIVEHQQDGTWSSTKVGPDKFAAYYKQQRNGRSGSGTNDEVDKLACALLAATEQLHVQLYGIVIAGMACGHFGKQ